ncbi:TMEM165/GDT1 family protein [Allosphingosinicella sp.]|jgi:putative Ca2+/H+ antiporter (TMEM165/GDT1 family)|uniref:TMEM165/GDT1 family protein n=1 Tax=Allosphingosinicella sp. TaxID=2823234 RepID=UPI002F0D3559
MNIGFYLTVFLTVFLAELADKTQIATVGYSMQTGVSRLGIFAASSLALVVSTALSVLLAGALSTYLAELPLMRISGVLFIAVGVVTLIRS